MAINKGSDNSISYASEIVVAAAQVANNYAVIVPKLVDRIDLPQGAKNVSVPKYAQLSASALTEGVAIASPTSLTVTHTTITPAEAGVYVAITRDAVYQMNDSVLKRIGRLVGEALGDYIDETGVDMFSGLNTTMGTAGTTLTVGHISAGLAKLTGSTALPPFVGVFHPYQTHRLRSALAPAGTYPINGGVAADQLAKYKVMSLFGVDIYEDGRIDVISGDDAYGAIFNKGAICYTEEFGIKVDQEWNIFSRAWDTVATVKFAFTELNGYDGCYMLFDAAAPSA